MLTDEDIKDAVLIREVGRTGRVRFIALYNLPNLLNTSLVAVLTFTRFGGVLFEYFLFANKGYLCSLFPLHDKAPS